MKTLYGENGEVVNVRHEVDYKEYLASGYYSETKPEVKEEKPKTTRQSRQQSLPDQE